MPGAPNVRDRPATATCRRKRREIKGMTAARRTARRSASLPRSISVPRPCTSKPNAPASSAICCAAKPAAKATFCCCAICFPPIRRWSKDWNAIVGSPGVGALAEYRLDRAPAIEADLRGAVRRALEPRHSPACRRRDLCATGSQKAAEGDGARLIAHAYTRYLGDLSGGQILQRLLARSLQLRPAELTFYDFPRFSDLDALKTDYRKALDQAGARRGRSARRGRGRRHRVFAQYRPVLRRAGRWCCADRPQSQRRSRSRGSTGYFGVLSPPDVRDECQIRCSSTSAVRSVELRTLSSISAMRPVSTP